MESIGSLIENNTENRFAPVLENERHKVFEDKQSKKFYCLQKCVENTPWCEVEYVTAMQKDAWDNWCFPSKQEEDEFTDAIAFCQVSGEVIRDGVSWIVWFDICDPDSSHT